MQSRFIPSPEMNMPLSNFTSFADYIAAMRAHIRAARTDLTGATAEMIIDANSPRESVPTGSTVKKGILLIHGLLDSPMMLKSLYDHFEKQGFLVRSLLLPGHGTRPADLLNVTLESWLETVRYGISTFGDEVDKLYLLGFSTGAGIALHHALHGLRCDGLILFAPPHRLANRFAGLSRYLRAFKWISPNAAWLLKADDNDYAKYQSLCYNAIYQVVKLARLLKAERSTSLKIPLFVVASQEDEAVDTSACLDYFRGQTHPESQFVLYSRHPQTFADARIQVTPSHLPDQKILDFSHVCLTVAPDHPHYGKQGDYQEFLHYQFALARRLQPPQMEVYQGAFNLGNLRTHYLQRLTYNPYFRELLQRLDHFTR
jgi:esterase/lipase